MGRTKEQQREYMAAYRARKKAAPTLAAYFDEANGVNVIDANARIAELEEEVRHLKRELASERSNREEQVRRKRIGAAVTKELLAHDPVHAFNSRPFTPVPRKRG